MRREITVAYLMNIETFNVCISTLADYFITNYGHLGVLFKALSNVLGINELKFGKTICMITD